jgi:carboxypeptidase C (cathepsin A)
MNFNGVVLVSPFLSVVSGRDGVEIDLPHVLFLPTFAATAWYHDAIAEKPASLEAFLEEVERFAYDEYAPALLKGYSIPLDEKRAIAARLARYTGTSAEYWERADLRVSHPQFAQELQRAERLVTGRIDSRFAGPALNPLSDRMDYDPFFPAVGPAFTSAFMDYLRNDLGFRGEEPYVRSASGLDWDWRHQQPGTGRGGFGKMPMTNTVPDLANALTMNPGLRVLVQHGRFDLATPYLAMKHDVAHLDVTPEARARVRIEFYESGHMMYLHEPSAKLFREHLVSFIRDSDRL